MAKNYVAGFQQYNSTPKKPLLKINILNISEIRNFTAKDYDDVISRIFLYRANI